MTGSSPTHTGEPTSSMTRSKVSAGWFDCSVTGEIVTLGRYAHAMTLRAVVLSIGDELTLGQIAERNAGWIAQEFLRHGALVFEHRTVRDDRSHIAAGIVELARKAEIVMVTGGLGPTEDDLTREALADALGGVELVKDDAAVLALRSRFEDRGRPMPPSNAKQALRPVNATCIANPNGSAPGLMVRLGGALVVCLPGPPNEMKSMVVATILPLLDAMVEASGGKALATCAIHSCGLPESIAAERIRELMDRSANPVAGTTASGAVVTARIRAVDAAAIDGSFDRAVREVERAWAPYVFGRDGITLAESLGEILRRSNDRVAVAESCTGGGIGSYFTSAAGSSEWFAGGWITYSNELKTQMLGIAPELIGEHGAVSEQVACAMALGAAVRAQTRFAVSVTGIAGPGGGTTDKPVGSVWIAVADLSEQDARKRVRSRSFQFAGDRETVRERTSRVAAQLVRLVAIGEPDVPVFWEVPRGKGGS